ncbi:MAG: hypothetical protein ABJL99_01580 [Aliishimia sp.]
MAQTIRQATIEDIPQLVDLLLLDAKERHSADPVLWKLADDASAQIEKALTFALTAMQQPFQQIWQVAEDDGEIHGVIHSMLLPVPPIYAGLKGDPGLILPDSFVSSNAPEGTVMTLLDAAENALIYAGAKIIISSFVVGDLWREAFETRNYEPLTHYMSRTNFGDQAMPACLRKATKEDVSGIVARSAENREVLYSIDPFWATHSDADMRFAGWMTHCLTYQDRDMIVMGNPDALEGYIIAQPATRLHFPPAHDISGNGVVDDYYHPELADTIRLTRDGEGATDLLRAAEAAFANRGIRANFVVCAAGWLSKIDLLEAAGYDRAMVWSIKR